MKRLTLKWLEDHGACSDAVRAYKAEGTTDLGRVIDRAMELGRFDWANWIVVRKMTRKQRIQYAVYAAELCLPDFEKAYPDDKRPREAINAAKYCIDHNTSARAARAAALAAAESAAWAARAAAWAAEAAAWSAAESAAWAAESAATSAESAATSARAAAWAAEAAARAAAWSAAWAAESARQGELIEYAKVLLGLAERKVG